MFRRTIFLLLIAAIMLSGCSLPSPTTPSGGETAPIATDPAVTASMQPGATQVSPPTRAAAATSTPSIQPAETSAPEAALEFSPDATATPDSIIPPGGYRFKVQVGTPIGTVNFVQPQLGCNWMGVAGQVFSLGGVPQTDLVVSVGGELNGVPVLGLDLTGLSQTLGPGGYEIKLADEPVASEGTLFIQIFNLAGVPQTDQIFFDTYGGAEGCEKNMILINFSGLVSEQQNEVILPLIFR